MPRGASGQDRTQKSFLTTHDVAQLLNVSLPTVVNWIEAGKITAHRTPGRHRRIAREELIRFAAEHAYPLPAEFTSREGPQRILVIDADPDMAEMLRDFLVQRGQYEVQVAEGAFEAGFLLSDFRPDVVILDTVMPGLDPRRALDFIRAADPARKIQVLACTAARNARSAPLLQDFDGQIPKPIRWEELLSSLKRA